MTAHKFVFSDLDYTIIFDSELDPRTTALIEQVRERARFIIVTARSHRECRPLPPIPNDGLVAENGAAVYLRQDGEDVLDCEWDAVMAQTQLTLDCFRKELEAEGWGMHYKRRAFSSSVTKSRKSERDVEDVMARVPEGLQLHLSHNTAGMYLEVFPWSAGKDKAVSRVRERLGAEASLTIGMGDSTNDLDLLRVVDLPLAPGNCHPLVRAMVEARGGIVSAEGGHPGAWEMLERALRALDGE